MSHPLIDRRVFVCGSSREQAATALQKRGIQCVIAASFSETYKRNAFNNGFVVFECPALVEYLTEKFGGPGASSGGATPQAATVVGPDIEIDYQRSIIGCDGIEFRFPTLSTVAQDLVIAGGAENLVKQRLQGATKAIET